MQTAFSLLGIEPAFDLDMDALQHAYLKAQQTHHPDRIPRDASPSQRLVAMQKSMAVNEAYQALKAPLSRAAALLRTKFILVGTERDAYLPSQALLVEVMEWREGLEEAANAEQIAAQVAHFQEMIEHQEAQLGWLFGTAAWEEAAQATLRLQYLDKTLADAKAKRRQITARQRA